tara:strand:+ start:248 stop:358 length:111 start_codon:yes stop_codon:yes gene_type:complete
MENPYNKDMKKEPLCCWIKTIPYGKREADDIIESIN